MPRNASGTFTLVAGNPVITGTIISSSWANPTMDDFAVAFTDSLSRTGQGGMAVPMRGINGTMALPAYSYTNSPNSGEYAVSGADLRMSISGEDKMRWQSSGVGVYIDGAWYANFSAAEIQGYLNTGAVSAIGPIDLDTITRNGDWTVDAATAAPIPEAFVGQGYLSTKALLAPSGVGTGDMTQTISNATGEIPRAWLRHKDAGVWSPWTEPAREGGATGGGDDKIFNLNEQTVTVSYDIPALNNANSTGIVTLADGVIVTVPTGSRWVIL
jgi:hypothetical protein